MSNASTMPASLRTLVEALRALYELDFSTEELWDHAARALEVALTDSELRTLSREWPQSHDRANSRYTNLLFHEDPDYGFVINGLVKDETGRTPVHDHGHAWVAYGLMEGAETIVRYSSTGADEPTGLADMHIAAEFGLVAGEVDLVPPWTFHAEEANTERSVALMVRSAKVGVFAHRRFDPTSGEIYEHPGPKQIDYVFPTAEGNR